MRATGNSNATLTIPFPAGDAALPDGYQGQLSDIAGQLRGDDRARLQLLAYASGDASAVSASRRRSLSRALEVRKVLIDAGMNPTRIDVRALGNRSDAGNPDRVDIVVIK